MIIRESRITTVAQWALVTWAWWFTTDLAGRADSVTSKQWQYLMSVPGHQWSWAALFAASAVILTIGMITERYTIRAAGTLLMGSGCMGIAVFYVVAPLIDPGLTTLGYHPWFGYGAGMLLVSVVNAKPVKWS